MSAKQSKTTKSKDRLCGLCDNEPSRYCCPRCEIFYCSVDCYKSEKHSDCSENFYRECVNQELASHQVDDDAKNKMIDILKRMHNESFDETENIEEIGNEDSDDDSDIDLHTRIKDLNLDDPDALWSALTADERNEFEAMLSQGDVGTLIPQWEPWWMYRTEKKLVEDEEDINTEKKALEKCPKIKSVPKFNTLTSVQPSPSIRFNLANVVAGYAFVMRYFNGEVDPIETSTYMLEVCSNLQSNTNFDDPELAVESVAQTCLQSEYIQTDKESLNVMKNDTLLILQGPSKDKNSHYSKIVFSHLIEIFTDAKAHIKKPKPEICNKNKGQFSRKFPEHDKSHIPVLDISKVKKVIKKLEYYLSFLDTCDNKSN